MTVTAAPPDAPPTPRTADRPPRRERPRDQFWDVLGARWRACGR